MELKEFVSETISQIIEGVRDASKHALEHGAEVNPSLGSTEDELGRQGMLWTKNGVAQIVKFDVGLTVTEGTGTKGGIGIHTGIIKLGSDGRSKSESSSVSRVQFSVPILLPTQK